MVESKQDELIIDYDQLEFDPCDPDGAANGATGTGAAAATGAAKATKYQAIEAGQSVAHEIEMPFIYTKVAVEDFVAHAAHQRDLAVKALTKTLEEGGAKCEMK